MSKRLRGLSDRGASRRSRYGRRARLANSGAAFEALEQRTLLAVTPLGIEAQINTTVANDQRTVAIGSNPLATQIIMAWVSVGEDAASSDGVYAQRYDLYGNKIGSAFRVNVTTSGNQNAPAVAMDSMGNFVVAWQSAGQDGSGDGIYARRYGYDATALATEFRVNSVTSGNQQAPAIAMNDVGEFVVAFQSSGRDANGNAVVVRPYTAAGAAVSANDLQVNTTTTGNQQAPSIAMDAAGNFIVAWQSASQDGSGDAVVGRRFTKTGSSLSTEFIVNTTAAGNQNAPAVAANADGSFVVAWQSALQDGNSEGIAARRYTSAGAANGGEFLVNQFSTGSQLNPSVTTAGSSGFVISWQSAAQDGNGDAVVVRRYTSAGAADGNEFVANNFVTGAQNNPAIAMQSDGDFIVAWQSPGQETGGSTSLGVFARRYSVVNDAPVLKQISNVVTDVGGTLAFTAAASDQDAPVDTLSYSLAPGAPVGAAINPTTGVFSWNTAGVTPGRYSVTVVAQDQAGLTDEKEVALTVFAPGERTVLDDYVNNVGPDYKWDLRGRTIGDGYIKYDLRLTSGMWRTAAEVNLPLWQHWVSVYVPNQITNSKALLFIDGGSNSATPPVNTDLDAYAGPIAAATGAVFIDLFSIPSEPLQFAGESFTRSEDAIIAYSWRKYLETGDSTWPVNLAMTRAVMRTMDAVTDMIGSPVGGNVDIGSFIVTGGSKRGWTTWLVSATDPRVSDAVPIVSDLLNMEQSFVHHYAYYNGTFSAAVNDYVSEGILDVSKFGTDGIDTLLSIVDPYTYRNRLTLPKFSVNASGDEFFVPDSSQYYYQDMLGPKALRYLPNVGHGIDDPVYVVDALNIFVTLLAGGTLPVYDFHQLADGTIEVTTSENVVDAKLWQATNPTKREFRNAVVGDIYTSSPLVDQGGGVFRGNVPTPPQGWTAYFVELSIENPFGNPFVVTSSIYLKGPPTNQPPVMARLDDLVINEGQTLTLPISVTDPDAGQTLTYSLNAGAPAQVTIHPNSGVITGLWNDQLASPVTLIVTAMDSGTPSLPARDTFKITVVNAPPTAGVTGPTTGSPGQSLSFTLSATDPSSVDQAAGFTFDIDWNGDGTFDQTVTGLTGTVVSHTFASGNSAQVRVRATDKDGGASTLATHTISLNQAPVDPQNLQPITIFEGDNLVLSATGWTDPDNDTLTYSWDVDGDGQFDDASDAAATVTWLDLIALGLGDDATSQLRLRVDDGHGGVTITSSVLLTIANVAPTANAGGPYAINEGQGVALTAGGSDPAGVNDPLSFTWDINGDDVFGDATGATPSLTWSQLVALGINNGPASFNVKVRVSDGDGGITDSAGTLLTVDNVAPTADAGGPYAIQVFQGVQLQGTGADPVDTLTYSWDINDDGIYGDAVGQQPSLTWSELQALGISPGTTHDVRMRTFDGTDTTTSSATTLTVGLPTSVLARQIFYNNSKFDGNGNNGGGVSTSDDLAIATDKSAYLPGGGQSTFANVTSYNKGINGVMIDLAGPHAASLQASDFIFRVGNNNTPNGWIAAPAPTTISIRTGGGTGGSDRVEIIWADGDIKNQWLQVIVASGANTGLLDLPGYPAGQGDVFFFGNKIGNVPLAAGGDTTSFAVVAANDQLEARGHLGIGAARSNLYDFDRNRIVDSNDELIARGNAGALRFIVVASPPLTPESGDAPLASPAASGGDADTIEIAVLGDTGLASALASTAGALGLGSLAIPGPITHPLELRVVNHRVVAPLTPEFEHRHVRHAHAQLAADDVVDDLGIDDSLLDAILLGR